MNFRFFISEAIRTLRRNSAPSIAAFLTVMVTTLVLGVFIPITNIATGAANDVRSRLLVEIFINDDATKAEIAELRETLEANPNLALKRGVKATCDSVEQEALSAPMAIDGNDTDRASRWSSENNREDASHYLQLEFPEEISVSFVVRQA